MLLLFSSLSSYGDVADVKTDLMVVVVVVVVAVVVGADGPVAPVGLEEPAIPMALFAPPPLVPNAI